MQQNSALRFFSNTEIYWHKFIFHTADTNLQAAAGMVKLAAKGDGD